MKQSWNGLLINILEAARQAGNEVAVMPPEPRDELLEEKTHGNQLSNNGQ